MEPVETVAADTTSDHSLPPHTQPSHPHRPHQSNEPYPKRPRLDSDPITSKQKPVGIAQPLIRHLPTSSPYPSDSEESQDNGRFSRLVNESDCKVKALKDMKSKQSELVERQSTSSQSHGLPWGRSWMVFISHSTSDQPWVKEHLLVPLRDNKIPVAASYHYRPDPSRYDDKAIQANMAKSCIVILALSQAYLSSDRCKREWQLAVKLRPHYEVVVARISHCLPPGSLESYLNLNFVDADKREEAWNNLNERIDAFMTPGCDGGVEVPSHQASEAHHHTVTKNTHAVTVDHPHANTYDPPTITHHHPPTITHHHPPTITDHHPHNTSSDFSYSPLQEDAHHMMDDFEQMYQENSDVYPPSSSDATSHVTCGEDHVISHYVGTHDSFREYSCNMDHVTDRGDYVMEDGDHVTDRRDHVMEDVDHVTDRGDHVIEDGDRVTKEVEDEEEGEVDDSSDETIPKQDDQASKVTSFYNQLARPEADKRQESPIFYMRNFNNWVKSVLIRSHLDRPGAFVLDLCCGKGGDLLKWKEGRIHHLVCADISDVSVEAAESRYHSKKMTRRGGSPPFTAEFICADCCQERLRERYHNPGRRFHLTSCQFSIHYSFESYDKAHMMLRNACENIVPGGYFIGTTVNANQLVYRLREAGQNEEGLWTFGNDIFKVTLDPSLDPHKTLPLFGAKYNFQLHGVVDLPEYIIHFPTFQSMLKEFDMEFVRKQNFADFFHERRHVPEDADLLYKMSAFDKSTGTMSADEWEAIGLYMVFVFRKHSTN